MAFLEKAVESASQFDEVKEIILVEDKSTDNSLILCEKIAAVNQKIKLYQHPDFGNHGAGASRNLGLTKATQEFVAFLDADDYYLPNRFSAEHEIFEDQKIDGVFGALGMEFLTEKGKEEFEKKFKTTNNLTTVNYAAEGKEIFNGLLGLTKTTFGTFFHLNTLTIRRDSLNQKNLSFNENLRVHQDQDFIVKLAYLCHLKSGIIDEAIAIRGVHDDNRITKIIPYSSKYNERQLLLWNSLQEWSEKANVEKEARKVIYLQKTAFQLSTEKGLKKGFHLLTEIIKNLEILRTRYRFTYLKR